MALNERLSTKKNSCSSSSSSSSHPARIIDRYIYTKGQVRTSSRELLTQYLERYCAIYGAQAVLCSRALAKSLRNSGQLLRNKCPHRGILLLLSRKIIQWFSKSGGFDYLHTWIVFFTLQEKVLRNNCFDTHLLKKLTLEGFKPELSLVLVPARVNHQEPQWWKFSYRRRTEKERIFCLKKFR